MISSDFLLVEPSDLNDVPDQVGHCGGLMVRGEAVRRSTKIDESARKINCLTYYGSSNVENVLISDIDRVNFAGDIEMGVLMGLKILHAAEEANATNTAESSVKIYERQPK